MGIMPALRLKTKLVLAITGMVGAIVAVLATLYISEVVKQRFHEVYAIADVINQHVFAVAKPALAVDLSSSRIDQNDPKQVENAIQELLQFDTGIAAVLESATGDSPSVLDVCIVDAKGLALLHTNPALQGRMVEPREDFSQVTNGGFRRQLKLIYGPTQTFDVRYPLVHAATG